MYNRITLVGRFTVDPETLPQASAARFQLAVDRDYKGKDGQRETDFIPCIAFGSAFNFVSKYCGKGDLVLVEGRLSPYTYTDKDDSTGKKRLSFNISVNKAELLLSKHHKNDAENPEKHARKAPKPKPVEDPSMLDDEDLPF